jgi:hypothetical protein
VSVAGVVDDYVKTPIEDVGCLAFWKQKEAAAAGDATKAALVFIAVKFLTPAATSIDVERLFSECGHILDATRNRTSPERLDRHVFLKKNMYLLGWELDLS